MALRLVRALAVVIRTVFLWALLGALGGGIYAYNQNDPEFVWTALFFAMIGGGVGLFIGFILALRVLFASRPPPEY